MKRLALLTAIWFVARTQTLALAQSPARSAQTPAHQVAITIDDLPLGGGDPGPCRLDSVRKLTARLLAPFREQKIPLTGFVNAGRCGELTADGLREVLDLWLDAGAGLGNHTYSHADLHTTALSAYEADIVKGEPAIKAALAALGRPLRFFRHPYLHTGLTLETKQAVDDFLASRGYRIAPVTLDNSDYMFAAVYGTALAHGDSELAQRARRAYVPYLESIIEFFERRSVEVAGHEFPQILLIHANQLNADSMPALIGMMRSRGYTFVTLDRALADDAYRLPDRYAGTGGFSWIHRWSKTKGMPPKGEPDEPAFVSEQYAKIRRTQ